MAKKPSLPNCRIQSIPTIAGLTIDQSELDYDALNAANPDIDKPYLAALKEELVEIRKLVPPVVLTDDMVEDNQKLDELILSARPLLNNLEIKINMLKGKLVGNPKHFGLKEARKCISALSATHTPAALETVLAHIDENTDILATKGFTATDRAAIDSLKGQIIDDFKEISKTVGARSELSQENRIVLSVFWGKIKVLLMTGKLLFANNAAKRREYTFAVLKRRVETPKKRKNKRKNNNKDNTPPSPAS